MNPLLLIALLAAPLPAEAAPPACTGPAALDVAHPTPPDPSTDRWAIQVGAFLDLEAAQRLSEALPASRVADVAVEERSDAVLLRVRWGDFPTAAAARAALPEIARRHPDAFVVRVPGDRFLENLDLALRLAREHARRGGPTATCVRLLRQTAPLYLDERGDTSPFSMRVDYDERSVILDLERVGECDGPHLGRERPWGDDRPVPAWVLPEGLAAEATRSNPSDRPPC